MSKFTDRLWQELMRQHRAELEKMPAPSAGHRRRVLPRLVAGTTVGLAGAGTAIALAIGAASSSPAFAVTKNPDGSVSVRINKLTGVAGANEKLAQYGVRAVAVPVVAGCAIGPPPPAALRAALVHARAAAIAAAGGTARIFPDKIPAGKRLVLAAGPGNVSIVQIHRAGMAPPTCFRQVFPPPWCRPAGGGTGTSTDTTTTGTVTAPPPSTNTTTTGTTTGPQTTTGPAHGWTCGPPPPICGPGQVMPPTSTSTSSTGTTTAPPTTTETNTTGTGTTTGPQSGPGPVRAFRCGMVTAAPACAPRAFGAAIPFKPGAENAAIRRKLVALQKARAALIAQLAHARAAAHKAAAKH
jgi:hypothetical protein